MRWRRKSPATSTTVNWQSEIGIHDRVLKAETMVCNAYMRLQRMLEKSLKPTSV